MEIHSFSIMRPVKENWLREKHDISLFLNREVCKSELLKDGVTCKGDVIYRIKIEFDHGR